MPDTAPRISGRTHHLLAVALRAPVVLKALHTLTGLIAAGTVPGQSMLCSSRLTSLLKPARGYRPIAVGELIYRLCTNTLLLHAFRSDFLLPFQFGVGTKGGVEPVIPGAQRTLDNSLVRPITHLTSLDFSNAFNSVDRGISLPDCAASLPASTERASGPMGRRPTSFRQTGRLGPPTVCPQRRECARVTLSVPTCSP
jgi:hypothetical protein